MDTRLIVRTDMVQVACLKPTLSHVWLNEGYIRMYVTLRYLPVTGAR